MKNKILSVALVIFSPMIYYYLTIFFRLTVSYQILHCFASKSTALFTAIFLLTDAACAIVTAFVVALPSGYLAGSKPLSIVLILIVAMLGFPVIAFFTQTTQSNLVIIDFIWQCVSLILSVYYFVNIGYRRAVGRSG